MANCPKHAVTQYELIVKIKDDNDLSLDRKDRKGWKFVWETAQGKEYPGNKPILHDSNKYFKWWFRDNGKNQTHPYDQKKYGLMEINQLKTLCH